MGEVIGNFDSIVVYNRVEKLVFKEGGTYFNGTRFYEWLDNWSLHVKHKSICSKYVGGNALSIEGWKKVYGQEYAKLSKKVISNSKRQLSTKSVAIILPTIF